MASTINPSPLLTSDQVLALADQAFSSNLQARILPGTSSRLRGVTRQIPVFYLPSEVEANTRLSALAAMTLPGRATGGETKEWQSWVLSYVLVSFPELAQILRDQCGAEYTVSTFPDSFLESLTAADKALEADSDATPSISFPSSFPSTSAKYTAEVYNSNSIPGVYGYCGLLLHLMGKRITPSTRDNMTSRRPGNIIDKFHVGDEAYILRGAGRMSDFAHTAINKAWDQSMSVRMALVPEFARLKGAGTLASEACYLLFGMLEYSGMQPAPLIHSLITACPWVASEIPILRPAYHLYVESVKEYIRAEPETRPFLKLMYGDQTRIFHAKSLSDLTACAVFFLAQTEPSLAGYTAPGGEKAKAAFAVRALAHGISLAGGMTGEMTSSSITAV